MSGAELPDIKLSIGHQFCNLMGGELVNLAYPGASNDRIYNTTLENLNQKIDFVLIAWTEMSRLQWFTTAEGHPYFYEINNLGIGRQPLPTEFTGRYNHWQKFMADSPEFRRALSLYWHERIYNLHQLLNYRGIPHLFFNTFERFHIYQEEYQLNWSQRYIDPYERFEPPITYVSWAQRNNYQEITPGQRHYEPKAALAWAELLMDHTRKHNLHKI